MQFIGDLIPEEMLKTFWVKNRAKKNINLQVRYELCQRLQPKTILEIGVRCGYSAFAMLYGAPEALYVGLDNFSYHPKDLCLNAFDQLRNIGGFLNCLVLDEDTQKLNTLRDLQSHWGWPYPDVVHVDGDHTFAGAIHDLDLAKDQLAIGGSIIIDDTKLSEVRTACVAWLNCNPEFDKRELADDYYGVWEMFRS